MNQRSKGAESRAKTFRHHTSKVTYGGIDGAYYTSSRTRRAGSDGVCLSLSLFLHPFHLWKLSTNWISVSRWWLRKAERLIRLRVKLLIGSPEESMIR